MIEKHEILCPSFLDCPLCQSNREEMNKSKILNLFGIEDDIHILSKHFYHLTISLIPTRETYHHFSLEPLKKVGRELLNGLSSISSVSNRKWWGMFVESGVRYYSIEQENKWDFPPKFVEMPKDFKDCNSNNEIIEKIFKKIQINLGHPL